MRNHPLLSLWKRLWRSRKPPGEALRAFELDQELAQTLHGLAEQEQRPARDIASDLLSLGLAHKNTSQELWQRWQSLSPREQQILALTCLNLTNRQIAAQLGIAPDTVKTHLRNIFYKFNAHSKAELRVALAGWDFSGWQRR